MSDFNEEQRQDEMIALESIYEQDLRVIDSNCVEISLSSPAHAANDLPTKKASSKSNSSATNAVWCTLCARLPPGYPSDAHAQVSILNPSPNITAAQLEQMTATTHSIIEDEANAGQLIVFQAASEIQEKLNEILAALKHRAQQSEEEKRLAKEKEEAQKFEGTRVTKQAFDTWRAAFELELEQRDKKKQRIGGGDDQSGKSSGKLAASVMTGKQMFLADWKLAESDLAILLSNAALNDVESESPNSKQTETTEIVNEKENAVDIDEALFENLEDLELE